MIRLLKLPKPPAVHVVGGGPGQVAFRAADTGSKDLIIAVNDAAYYALAGRRRSFIHLTADYPYARDKPVALGALGVWVRHGDHPFPRRSEFPMWVPGVGGADHLSRTWSHDLQGRGVTVMGWGGVAAYSLAYLTGAEEVNLWGFDGGPGYEGAEEAIQLAIESTSRWTETIRH